MSRWQSARAQRQRTQKALQLLIVSGSIRTAEAEPPRYYGSERVMGSRPKIEVSPVFDQQGRPPAQRGSSVWTLDLREVLNKWIQRRGPSSASAE